MKHYKIYTSNTDINIKNTVILISVFLLIFSNAYKNNPEAAVIKTTEQGFIADSAMVVSARKEASEIGLVDQEIEGDLVEGAVEFAKKLVKGEVEPREFMKGGSDAGLAPQEINIGHLSKKIDEIMNKAIYEGIKLKINELNEFSIQSIILYLPKV